MAHFGPEIGLLYAVALSAGVLFCAARLARRFSDDALQHAADTLLLFFVVQYAAVALPGCVGHLNLWTITATAGILSGLFLCFAFPLSLVRRGEGRVRGRATNDRPSKKDPGNVPLTPTLSPAYRGEGENAKRPAMVMLFFVAAAAGMVVYLQRTLPPTATDALTYHLPAAAQWLGSGKLGLFSTWFFNPANTFSPLAGSAFIAYWMAPLGGDVLARFAQVQGLLLIFFALAALMRSLGCGAWLAALMAAAAVVARPFLSQAILCLDDLYLAAFVACALAACAPDRLGQRGGAARLGIALGMALAIKYTALLALPIFLPALDAPWRAGWKGRAWATAAAAILLLAGPWYLRNLLCFGNPIYPVDLWLVGHGLFTARPAPELSHLRQLWDLLSGPGSYFGLPRPLLGALAIAYALAVGGWLRSGWQRGGAGLRGWVTQLADRLVLSPLHVLRERARVRVGMRLIHETGSTDAARPSPQPSPCVHGEGEEECRRLCHAPLLRLCVWGPPLGLAAFVALAPYAQARFLLPTLLLVFAAAAAGISSWLKSWWAVAAGGVILAIAAATNYADGRNAGLIAAAAVVGAAAAAAYLGLMQSWPALRRRQPLLAAAALAGVGIIVYVNWKAYVSQCRSDADLVWQSRYPNEAGIWHFVRSALPPDAALAYANTYLVYPLLGAELRRRVFYVPARNDVEGWRDVPHFEHPASGKALEAEFTRVLDAREDRAQWLGRLAASGAKYLVVFKHGPSEAPPEWHWAQSDPEHFVSVFENPQGVVYEIRVRMQLDLHSAMLTPGQSGTPRRPGWLLRWEVESGAARRTALPRRETSQTAPLPKFVEGT